MRKIISGLQGEALTILWSKDTEGSRGTMFGRKADRELTESSRTKGEWVFSGGWKWRNQRRGYWQCDLAKEINIFSLRLTALAFNLL